MCTQMYLSFLLLAIPVSAVPRYSLLVYGLSYRIADIKYSAIEEITPGALNGTFQPVSHHLANAWCQAAQPAYREEFDILLPFECTTPAIAMLCYSGGDDLLNLPSRWGLDPSISVALMTGPPVHFDITPNWSALITGHMQPYVIGLNIGPPKFQTGCTAGWTVGNNCNDFTAPSSQIIDSANMSFSFEPLLFALQYSEPSISPCFEGLTRFLCVCNAVHLDSLQCDAQSIY